VNDERPPIRRKSRLELLDAEEIVFEVDEYHGGARLDAFLTRSMTWRSRTSIQKLIKEGKVELARRGANLPPEHVRAATIVLTGDRIEVALPKPKRDAAALRLGDSDPKSMIRPIFEDDFLLALDKPPNAPVHPAGQHLHRTIITALHKLYRRFDDPARDVVPKLCHRLDLETSGVLLCAKHDVAHRLVSEQMLARTPRKEYLAIVHGDPPRDHDMIDLPLGPALGRIVMVRKGVRYDAEGRPSRTEYFVERRFGAFALLRLRLHTGRMHQIRVHCAAIGHPLVGDKIYNGDEEVFLRFFEDRATDEDRAKMILPRHALHAARLELTHPMTSQPLVLEAPLAPDLQAFLDRF
jgi:23S rRNA pseudouridine1911/1915/1917 synthase